MANDKLTIDDIISNPEFTRMSLKDKNSMLMSFPEFSSLSGPDRVKMLRDLHYGPQEAVKEQAGQQGFFSSLGAAVGVPENLSDVPQAMNMLMRHPVETSKMLPEVGKQFLQGQSGLLDKAKQQFQTGNFGRSGAELLNYLVPGVGQLTSKASEQLEEGNIAGAAGTTLGAAAPLVLGTETGRGAVTNLAGKVLPKTPSELSAAGGTNIFNAINPKIGAKAEKAIQMENDVAVAKPHLAEIQRQFPMEGTLWKRLSLSGKPEWFSQLAEKISNYKEDLWERYHNVPVNRHKDMPFDNQAVIRKALDEILPEDDDIGKTQATKWVTREIGKLDTLKSADTKIRLLNQEIKKLPEHYGPVVLRVMSRAQDALREQLDLQLQSVGEQGVRTSNRAYGALRNIEDRLNEQYYRLTLKEAKASKLPDWAHLYIWGHPSGMAFGLGVRAYKFLSPSESGMLVKGLRQLEKSGMTESPTALYGNLPASKIPSLAPGNPVTLGQRLMAFTRALQMIPEEPVEKPKPVKEPEDPAYTQPAGLAPR